MPFNRYTGGYVRSDRHIDIEAYFYEQKHRIELWEELEGEGFKIDWKELASSYRKLLEMIPSHGL